MRVAVVSDIHGNVWALDAVLERLEGLDVDHVVNLGDCFWGPLAPGATFDRLRDREEWITVRGNQDRILLEGAGGPTDRITFDELGDEGVRWVERHTRPTRVIGALFACHGTPDRDDVTLMERVEPTHVRWASPGDLATAIHNVGPDIEVVLCGHSHRPAVLRSGDGRLIVNPGSVGLPAYDDDRPHPHRMEAGSPHARWAVLERTLAGWSVDLIATPYDSPAAARAAREHGREDWARWIEAGRAMGRTDQASRTIHAPPAALYRAFEDPRAMEAWLPPSGMTGHMEAFDFRDGGSYSMRLTYRNEGHGTGKSSADSDRVEVRFLRLIRDRLIEQAVTFDSDDPRFSGVMTMRWTFAPTASGTEVSVRCENVPEGITPEDHEAGLNSTLANLARFTE